MWFFFFINLALALCRDFYPFFTRFGPGAFLLLPANRQDLKIWCWSHNGDITRATCEKSFHTPPAVLAIPTLRERPNVHFEKRQRGFVKRHVGAEIQTSHQTLGLLLKIEFCKMIWYLTMEREAKLKRFRESIYGGIWNDTGCVFAHVLFSCASCATV